MSSAAFAAVAERHRGELQRHCVRLMGSRDDAEDMVQETFLRAWRMRDSLRGGCSAARAWLYRIATNVCLDALAKTQRRAKRTVTSAELPEPAAPRANEPHVIVAARDSFAVTFLPAIERLPQRPRTALVTRDVLGWSAKDAAALAGATEASVNSALQRARAAVRHHALHDGH